ncbi:MAG: tetratricopeptide repeat protein [Elusimicrobiota bacterium]
MEARSTYSNIPIFGSLLSNTAFYFKSGTLRGLLNLNRQWLENFHTDNILIFLLALSVLAVTVYGFFKQKKTPHMVPIGIYVILHILFHIFWINVSIRYLVPVLPFLLYYFVCGMSRFSKTFFRALTIIILIIYLQADARILLSTSPGGLSQTVNTPSKPFASFKWIIKNTDDASLFFGNYPDRFYFNTKRRMIYRIMFSSRDEFYMYLLSSGFDYVAYFSVSDVQTSSDYSIHHEQSRKTRVFLSDVNRFKPVYKNIKEDVAVWKIIKNSDFIKAWKEYSFGITFLKQKKFNEAEERFKKALDIWSDFPLVSANLSLLYINRKDYANAGQLLDNAIRLYPHEPQLTALRADISRMKGKTDLAAEYYRKALRAAIMTDDKKMLQLYLIV